jgi:hypothetical protein
MKQQESMRQQPPFDGPQHHDKGQGADSEPAKHDS